MDMSNKKLPAILWVRSSLSNCFTSTVSSFSCFNCPGAGAFPLEDFILLAIGNKDIKNSYCPCRKNAVKEYVISSILCRFGQTACPLKLRYTLLLLLFSCGIARAQQPADTMIVDIGQLTEWKVAYPYTWLYVDKTGTRSPAEVIRQPFERLSQFVYRRRLPPDYIPYVYFLKTEVYNSSREDKSFYFFPGSYFDKIAFYKVQDGVPVAAHPVPGKKGEMVDGCCGFNLAAGERAMLLAVLKPCKIEFNNLGPVIIKADFVESYKLIISGTNYKLKNFSYVLSGTLLMMILFMLTNYVISRRKEFLWNSGYSLSMFLLIFLNAYTLRNTTNFTNLYLSYIDFFLLVVGSLFYMKFSRTFLNSARHYKNLDKVLKWGQRFLALLLLVYTYLNFFTNAYTPQVLVENATKFIMLGIGISFIILAIKERDRLMNYLAAGNAALVFFSAVSLGIIWFKVPPASIFVHSLFYYYIGIVLELVFFLLGLNYKNKMTLIEKIKEQEALKLEAEKQEFQTQLAVIKAQQEERNRISADMHDDLGAGMTTIRLYSELAKDKLGDKPIPEIEKISSSANELLTKMNAIIWSMSSSNDSLNNMIAYIRSYALEYFENSGIDCKIILPSNLPNAEVSGKIRRNVFLVVKEALNNAMKHAKATRVTITLVRKEDQLILYIQDNGVGINFDQLRQFSNGLINMRKRMADVDIDFSIENNGGTLVTMAKKIPGFS